MNEELSNKELCYLWAHQKEGYGLSPSLYFKGRSLYEMDGNTEIARFIDKRTIFILAEARSVHLQKVSKAIPENITQYFVKSFKDHKVNIKAMKELTYDFIRRAVRAKLYSQAYIIAAENILLSLLDYLKRFNYEPDIQIAELERKFMNEGLLDELTIEWLKKRKQKWEKIFFKRKIKAYERRKINTIYMTPQRKLDENAYFQIMLFSSSKKTTKSFLWLN